MAKNEFSPFPFRIVNVQWGGGLAVEFGEKDQDAPSGGGVEPTIMRSRKKHELSQLGTGHFRVDPSRDLSLV